MYYENRTLMISIDEYLKFTKNLQLADYSIYLDVDPKTTRKRILDRNRDSSRSIDEIESLELQREKSLHYYSNESCDFVQKGKHIIKSDSIEKVNSQLIDIIR